MEFHRVDSVLLEIDFLRNLIFRRTWNSKIPVKKDRKRLVLSVEESVMVRLQRIFGDNKTFEGVHFGAEACRFVSLI